ncbi:PREDICTED: uncharacterized protein LOC106744839 [Dinoponera quadriceps]|uniref:Uncharacterized protein LOC106744839 n=1 Tax=Dinoponera quadriceps TaxID=609295 RepID=A0A6P3XAT7_DINQU|nr:PREDICTED: uncharacterized protein LOC106744839 [Dinoponera quadriceps]
MAMFLRVRHDGRMYVEGYKKVSFVSFVRLIKLSQRIRPGHTELNPQCHAYSRYTRATVQVSRLRTCTCSPRDGTLTMLISLADNTCTGLTYRPQFWVQVHTNMATIRLQRATVRSL